MPKNVFSNILVLGLIAVFLWVALPTAIVPTATLPTAAPTPSPTPPPTQTQVVNYDYSWIGNTPLEPMSDAIWSPDRPTPINNSGWDTIANATSMEIGCITEFMYWTWMSESGELDCTEALTRPGQNECRSSAGAEGPFQFMGAFNEAGISEPGWSEANLHDSARAACRMWTKMDLWSHVGDRQSFALRFSSLDVYNAGRIPQFWTDRAWNVGQDGYNQALWIWDQANQP